MCEQKIQNFRDLKIWQAGKKIVLAIYKITNTFPKSEEYNLSSQMKRSAISIPSNIAEGFNRFHNKEYRQFLYISLGSLAELETQLEIAYDIKLISNKMKDVIIEQINHETRMIRNLIKKL